MDVGSGHDELEGRSVDDDEIDIIFDEDDEDDGDDDNEGDGSHEQDRDDGEFDEDRSRLSPYKSKSSIAIFLEDTPKPHRYSIFLSDGQVVSGEIGYNFPWNVKD